MPSARGTQGSRAAGGGLVREGVETLRAGWPADPITSETVPLSIQRNSMHSYGSDRSLLNGLDQLLAVVRATEGGADAPARIAAGQHAAVGEEMPPAHAAQGRELAA